MSVAHLTDAPVGGNNDNESQLHANGPNLNQTSIVVDTHQLHQRSPVKQPDQECVECFKGLGP